MSLQHSMIKNTQPKWERTHTRPFKFTGTKKGNLWVHNSFLWHLFNFQLCSYLIAFLVFMYTIRFIRLLRFNKKISVLGDTLVYVSKPIISFMVVFIMAFCAFAMTAYAIFGKTLYTFRNFVVTMETLVSMMLSKLSLYLFTSDIF